MAVVAEEGAPCVSTAQQCAAAQLLVSQRGSASAASPVAGSHSYCHSPVAKVVAMLAMLFFPSSPTGAQTRGNCEGHVSRGPMRGTQGSLVVPSINDAGCLLCGPMQLTGCAAADSTVLLDYIGVKETR